MRLRKFSVQTGACLLNQRTCSETISQTIAAAVAAQLMPKQKQLHIWLSETDHEFLSAYAADRGEAMGATVRRLIRHLRREAASRQSVSQSVSNKPT